MSEKKEELREASEHVLKVIRRTETDTGVEYTRAPDLALLLKEPHQCATFVGEFTDPTPLSELTDEQWREINAERKSTGWSVPVGENVIAYMLSANRLAIHWGFERTPLMFNPTLGQLRALMFALGGGT